MQLSPDQVDAVWSKLTVTYGRDFLFQWHGLPPEAVKQDWACELGGFRTKPWAIAYALAHLPLKLPMTVLTFRALCAQAPEPSAPAEPAPAPADVRRAAAVLSQLAPTPYRSGRDWAHKLMQREVRGEKLGLSQRESWRLGLGLPRDVDVSVAAAQFQVAA